jgi:UPF0716 family protein affecting phage T7 exclusion
MKTKRGLVWNEIVWWVIGLIVLVLVIAGIILLNKSGTNLLDRIKDMLRFGR